MDRRGLHPTVSYVCAHACVCVYVYVSTRVSGTFTHSFFVLKEPSVRKTDVKRLECVHIGRDTTQGNNQPRQGKTGKKWWCSHACDASD